MIPFTQNNRLRSPHHCALAARKLLQHRQVMPSSFSVLVVLLSFPSSTTGVLTATKSPHATVREFQRIRRTAFLPNVGDHRRGSDASLRLLFVPSSFGSELKSLAEQIRSHYCDKETDGVLELAASPSFIATTDLDVKILIPAILEAVGEEKGAVASVMNAMIGSCILAAASDKERAKYQLSDRVDSLMNAYEELAATEGITPDVVSYSLAYTAFQMEEDDRRGHDRAEIVLQQARRQTKKLAGGRRRKQLASSRRKSQSTFVDEQEQLRDLLGVDFQVLLETDDFAVISKPSGVPCFHRKATTAGKIKKDKKGNASRASLTLSSSTASRPDISLEDAFISCNVPLSTLNPDALGLVHRLDRGTSGCMVLAKTDEAHARLVTEFFLRRTTKKYATLVYYDCSSSSTMSAEGGVIELPVNGRPARSLYRVLDLYEDCGKALLEFEIFTGRKHQIRVHAAKGLGSPVVNDALYSDGRSHVGSGGEGDDGHRFFLHSSMLSIPSFGIDVRAPIPSWWDATISSFGTRSERQ